MSTQTATACRAASVLEGKLRRLARTEHELDRLRSELNARLDAVRGVYARRIAALEASVQRGREAIEQLCRGQRDVLFREGSKTLRTPYGKVGFRWCEPRVLLADEGDVEGVCEELRRRRLAHLVRISSAPDKPAVKRALSRGEVTLAQLGECGLKVTDPHERFYCVINKAGHGAEQ